MHIDISWVASLETPSWSIGVASLRDGIRNTARELAVTTAMEDRLQWETCVGREFSNSSKAANANDECALHDEKIVENTKSVMDEAILWHNNPRDIASVIVTTNAPDLNLITESDNGIEGKIKDCPYNFNSHLKIDQTPAVSIVEAEKTHVLGSI